jgi:flagellar biosynthetic protein FlhB
MAEQAGERTEEPTARRLLKAREEGRVARSTEVSAAAVTVISVLMLFLSGAWLASGMASLFRSGFTLDRKALNTPHTMLTSAGEQLLAGFGYILPIMLVTMAVAIVASSVTGGFLFSIKAVQPNMDKLSLVNGLKRMFGTHALIELAKAMLKFGLVGTVLLLVFHSRTEELAMLGRMGLEDAVRATAHLVMESALWVTLALLVIAAIDVPLQRFQFTRGMRMTKQEIKDEMKEAEGRPEVRAQIRRRQREMATARMMRRVKDADVIITNPDHFAVALSYDPTSDAPPLLVAKGIDHAAARIREEGARHGVTIFEAPPLARALYFTTELEHPVPEELYFAVAQVIAYVYSLADVKPGVPPALRPHPRVPASMMFNTRGERLGEQGALA